MNRKIKIELTLDLDSHNYDISFRHVSGGPFEIDYYEIKDIVNKVFIDLDNKIADTGMESTEQFIKAIH